MTRQLDIESILDGFLAEGAEELADHVLDAALTDIDDIPQRRSWWPTRRLIHMDIYAKTAIAAAAVLAVALFGYNLLPGNQIGGRPTPTPLVSPTPSPTPPPEMKVGELAAGSYLVSGFTKVPFTVTVPNGWAMNADGFIYKGGAFEGRPNATGVAFATWLITHVYADSCQWGGTLHAVGSRQLLASALAGQKGHTTSGPTEVTVGGHAASRLVLSVAADFDRTTCQSSVLRLWPDPGPEESGGHRIYPGQTTTVYALEDSGKAWALFTVSNVDSAAADVAELQGILGSVHFIR